MRPVVPPALAPRLLLLCAAALSMLACGSETRSSEAPIVLTDPNTEGGEVSEPEPALVISDDTCETDADCAPAGCCHAAACGAVTNAPSCEDLACTADCQFGTLDCGGACLCHEGRCAARLSRPPELTVQ